MSRKTKDDLEIELIDANIRGNSLEIKLAKLRGGLEAVMMMAANGVFSDAEAVAEAIQEVLQEPVKEIRYSGESEGPTA